MKIISGGEYFLRIPHERLVWNVLEVRVRQEGEKWEFSIGYQGPERRFGGPWTGELPSRESAGRNGAFYLRDRLRMDNSDFARGLIEKLENVLKPAPQLDFFGMLERGAA